MMKIPECGGDDNDYGQIKQENREIWFHPICGWLEGLEFKLDYRT